MREYFANDRATIYHGDCRDIMEGQLPDNWVDSIVTDPPYELGFMGKGWDGSGVAYNSEVWENAYRILKPGGHLLAFGGTRTWHRLASAIEDAGFEIRDSIAWMYGSGFPKSHDVSKGIDKAAGFQGRVVGRGTSWNRPNSIEGDTARMNISPGEYDIKELSPAAQQWQGWGTALKPAFEPIVVARKPLIGTVAENVLAHGTGALNIDACRIGTEGGGTHCGNRDEVGKCKGHDNAGRSTTGATVHGENATAGRWPANVILDESQAAELDAQSGVSVSKAADYGPQGGIFRLHGFSSLTELEAAVERGEKCPDGRNAVETLRRYRLSADRDNWRGHNDSGGASRFFYSPKASKKERPVVDGVAHPTVKPLALMRYLCKLVTPQGGTILEPFAGSGTTIEAALNEGFNVIGIEMTDEYLPLIMSRIERCNEGMF